MVIKFNPELFVSGSTDIQHKTSKIILDIMLEKFVWDIDNLDEIFLSEEYDDFFKTPFSQNFLSPEDKKLLEKKISEIYEASAYITKDHIHYLNNITIGTNSQEINPNDAFRIINEPSKLIVENENDWSSFIGILEKYKNHKKRKSIYELIKKAVDNNWIEHDQAGGKTEIYKRIVFWKDNRYLNIHKYKLATIFDSDRTKNDNTIAFEQKKIIDKLKSKSIDKLDEAIYEDSDLITWHILYKREMENYLPLEIVIQELSLSEEEKNTLLKMQSEELDFIKYEEFLEKNKEVDSKKEFPKLFNFSFNREKIEQRCEEHKVQIKLPNGTLEEVSEIEQILLKIAKII